MLSIQDVGEKSLNEEPFYLPSLLLTPLPPCVSEEYISCYQVADHTKTQIKEMHGRQKASC